MFKVNNKDNRAMSFWSFWCFYFKLWTYFTHFSSVSIIYFEQVNVSWVLFEASNFIQGDDWISKLNLIEFRLLGIGSWKVLAIMAGSLRSKNQIEIKYKNLKYRQKVALIDSKEKKHDKSFSMFGSV